MFCLNLFTYYFYLVESFYPIQNLDAVFIYNHIALTSLRSRSHVKAYVILTRADHLCIHNYIICIRIILISLN